MIENSMFYMNFETSSDSQKRCVEAIRRMGLDDIMNPIYLLKKPIIDKKADYDYQDACPSVSPLRRINLSLTLNTEAICTRKKP